jgi:hypothetical protein
MQGDSRKKGNKNFIQIRRFGIDAIFYAIEHAWLFESYKSTVNLQKIAW